MGNSLMQVILFAELICLGLLSSLNQFVVDVKHSGSGRPAALQYESNRLFEVVLEVERHLLALGDSAKHGAPIEDQLHQYLV